MWINHSLNRDLDIIFELERVEEGRENYEKRRNLEHLFSFSSQIMISNHTISQEQCQKFLCGEKNPRKKGEN
jgi:hypothetical protein